MQRDLKETRIFSQPAWHGWIYLMLTLTFVAKSCGIVFLLPVLGTTLPLTPDGAFLAEIKKFKRETSVMYLRHDSLSNAPAKNARHFHSLAQLFVKHSNKQRSPFLDMKVFRQLWCIRLSCFLCFVDRITYDISTPWCFCYRVRSGPRA